MTTQQQQQQRQYTLDEVQTLLGVPRDTPLQCVFEEFATHVATNDPIVAKTARIEQDLLSYHLDVHFVEARESVQAKSNEECGYFQRQYYTSGRCDVPNVVDDNAWQNRLVVFAKLGEANADGVSNHALQHALNALGAKSELVFETIDMLLSMGDASRLTKRALMSDAWADILVDRQSTTNVLLDDLNSLLSIGLLLKPIDEIKDAVKSVSKFLERMHSDLKRQWEFINGTDAAADADEGTAPILVTSKSKPQQQQHQHQRSTSVQSGMKLFSTELQTLPPYTTTPSRSRSPSRAGGDRVMFQHREVVLAPSTAGPVGEHLLSPVELHRAQTSELSVKWTTALTYIAANVLLALLKYLADARQTTDWQIRHQASANFVVKTAAQAFGYDPVANWRVFYVPYVVYQWTAWLVIGSNQQSPPWDWLWREFVRLMLRVLPTPLFFAVELTIGVVPWVTLAHYVFNAYAAVNLYRYLAPLRALGITNVEQAQITSNVEHAVVNRLIEYVAQALQKKKSQGETLLALLPARTTNNSNDDDDDNSGSDSNSSGDEIVVRPKRIVDVQRGAATARNIDQILARPTQPSSSPSYSRSNDTLPMPPAPPPMIPSVPTSPRRSLRTRKAKH